MINEKIEELVMVAHALNKVTSTFIRDAESQSSHDVEELAAMVAEYIFVLELAVMDMKQMFGLQNRGGLRGN